MKIKILLLSALSLWTPDVNAAITIKKWHFSSHVWRYVGEYSCTHLGEVRAYTNSEINIFRVTHYNNDHQSYSTYVKLWVRNPDGQYIRAHSIESPAKGNLYFQNNAAMQSFLANLTS